MSDANFATKCEVPQWRLDDYVNRHKLPAPDLIKMDTQGSEHLIIAGGTETVAAAQVLMIETWLSPEYGPSTPLLQEIMESVRSLGFRLLDFGDTYRGEGGQILAVDAVFTKYRERFA
jgi:hypothetical protein